MPRPISAVDTEIYLFAHDFNWQEFDNGGRLLEESGIRYGLGGSVTFPIADRVDLSLLLEGYIGDVDYDGGVISVDAFGSIQTSPLKSTTSYLGGRLEGLLSYKTGHPASGFAFDPFVGVGLHGWKRELGSRFGYDEYWQTLYVPVGIRLEGAMSPTSSWFARAQVNIPLITDESIRNLPGGGGTDLSPDAQLGLSAELGFQFNRMTIAGFYESYEFDASDPDLFGTFQPDSEARTIGVRLGYRF